MGVKHKTALILLVATVLVWLVAMASVLERTRPRGPSLVAVFPPGTSETTVMSAVTRAEGRLVRGTWWPWAYVVDAESPTFVDDVRRQGVLWVLPGGPFRLAMTGGCGFPAYRWGEPPTTARSSP